MRLVAERGLDATSMDECRSMRHKATIYKHWPDDEDALLLEVMADPVVDAFWRAFAVMNSKPRMIRRLRAVR
jgi:hypothetical protein